MRINLLHPAFWDAHGHWPYRYQIPTEFCDRHSVEFVFNDPQKEFDFVVVHENLDARREVVVKEGGLVLVTGEEQTVLAAYNQEFLDQFDVVVTSRGDIVHRNIYRDHYWHPWRIRRSYEDLNALKPGAKSRPISAIISGYSTLPLQTRRLEFVKYAKSFFGADLDWFSKGQSTFIDDKFEGLYPYQYSIAVENSIHQNYFTEKISDCFLSYAMPLYQGCPNISDFFDDRSYIDIDVENADRSCAAIREILSEGVLNSNLTYLRESRRLVLEKYQFLAALGHFAVSHPPVGTKVRKIINPQNFFLDGPLSRLVKSIATKVKGKLRS